MTFEIRFAALGRRGNDLLERARTVLNGVTEPRIQALASRVPPRLASTQGPPRLVFAGQFSAGKSTLLRAMTGREDIEIGAGITTQEVSRFHWNGLEIVDTPGIHTQLRPDHDALSYEAIAAADLLVFVITNELMDDHIAMHFRMLAIERDKGQEMLLVVNKMSRHQLGNSPEAQSIVTGALRSVLSPLTPESLYLSFVDAKLAVDSVAESDRELATADLEDSGIAKFYEAIDRFVAQRGLSGRFTSPLYELEQVLVEAEGSLPSGDPASDGVYELLLQKRRALLDAKVNAKRACAATINDWSQRARQEGRKVADAIGGDVATAQLNQMVESGQKQVESYAEQLGSGLKNALTGVLKDADATIEKIVESEFAQQLLPDLVRRCNEAIGGKAIDVATLSKFQTAAGGTNRLGDFLIKASFNPAKGTFGGLFKLSQYSGTQTHQFVKWAGGLFGKKFMPWQAVKWTRHVANAGRVFVVAGTVLTVVLQIKEDLDNARREKDLREARSALRSGFNEAAAALESHYSEVTDSFVKGTLDEALAEVDAQLAELIRMRDTGQERLRTVSGLVDETRALIKDAHIVST